MRVILFVILSFVSVTAFSEATKIAIVDVQKALVLSDVAKKGLTKFEKSSAKDLNKLKKMQKDLVELKEKLQKNELVMSDSEFNKLKSKYEEQVTEYKFYAQKFQQQRQKVEQEILKELLPKAEKLLKKIIDDGKYDLVLQADRSVVFAKPRINLTKKLLDSLNKN